MHRRGHKRSQLPYDWRRVGSSRSDRSETVDHTDTSQAVKVRTRTARSRTANRRSTRVQRRSVGGRSPQLTPKARRQRLLPWLKPVMGVALLLVFTITIVRALAPSPSYTAQSEDSGPSLHQPIAAWYSPDGDVFGAVAAGTNYQLLATYGSDWLQVEFADQGQFWVRAADLDAEPSADLPDLLPPVVGYNAYTVAPGDSLTRIASIGGSDANLIGTYNHVQGTPPSGRPLIVPQLSEKPSILTDTALIVKQGDTTQPAVALTIDLETGEADVERMLDTLRERSVNITIFVLGPWVEQHPELARQIVADGHELANHSVSHADFRALNAEQIAHELAETERIVQETTGATTRPYFRPPYGHYDERVLQTVIDQGYLPVYWSIDSGDAVGAEKSFDDILQQMTDANNPEDLYGAVILAHCCIRTTTVDALPAVLDRFQEMGIEVRTLSAVLGS